MASTSSTTRPVSAAVHALRAVVARRAPRAAPIAAPGDKVRPWVAQLGQARDRFPRGVASGYALLPELPHVLMERRVLLAIRRRAEARR